MARVHKNKAKWCPFLRQEVKGNEPDILSCLFLFWIVNLELPMLTYEMRNTLTLC